MAQRNGPRTGPVINICLTGFMCAGKTRSGAALARALKRPFADCDALLERKHGASPADLINKKGLGHFRTLETALVRSLAESDGQVIALGGGFYPSGSRAALLKKAGLTVFLYCPWPELEERLKSSRAGRPLLAGPWAEAAPRAKKLYEARLPYYRRADIIVNVAGLNPAQTAVKLKRSLQL
ncbi:MAG TPA: shikimate kinase [Elusimicrobia bacterium]|nr:shikimate kinase [Elusimicrobiota bacterium]